MKQKTEAGISDTGSADRKPQSQAFEELMRFYESRIEALKSTRDSLETAKPVLTPPSTPPGSSVGDGDLQTRNRALLALELLAEMVDDLTMNVVFETHFEAKQSIAVCSNCNTRCQSKTVSGIQASSASADTAADMFECQSCQRSFPAARFASHMDKCMGLSSRRTATRRTAPNSAASTPNYPLANYDSSSEQSADRKRKSGLGSAKDAAVRKKARRK
ncbi:hypothetical protein LPJ64_000968 [Coemansia asiatica]|uniref:SAGA-associated factor 11 n=1 Tax=Coemansia asiatica TaxID=1052880 RepID=A0A9W7XPW9_9FUNG|nr:hypothetical protein LPJ64_000968 [Coemansia asiatica]